MKDRDLFNQLEESVPEIKESKERTWKRTVFSQKEIPPSVNG